MFLLLCACAASGLVFGSPQEKPYYDVEQADKLFEDFIATYNKIYSNEEKQIKLGIFTESLKRVNERNTIGDTVFDINHLSDLTLEELNNYFGFIPSTVDDSDCDIVTDKDVTTDNAPAAVNWSSKGAVTAIKNQGSCGACWAFACIANIEGQYFIKNKQLQTFSEQEILDCSKNNPSGCNGGDMITALIDLKELGGVELESNYPYDVKKGETCLFNSTEVVAKVVGCKKYVLENEKKLKEILDKKGPLIIGVNGAQLSVYKKGIMTKKECDYPLFMGHAVLLMGYDTENGSDYWILKNSWGPEWGEKGYFRLSRGENTCDMMQYIASADL